MSEDGELQARIAHLAGRINQHKNQNNNSPASSEVTEQRPVYYGPRWPAQRGTPYGAPRGRGWNSRPAQHRNRTLVLNQTGSSSSLAPTAGDGSSAPAQSNENTPPAGWVTKHDRHMQLINSEVYEKKTQERAQAIKETNRKKQLERDNMEKSAVMQHAQTFSSTAQQSNFVAANKTVYHVYVRGIGFAVADGGSKLIRMSQLSNSSEITPKHAHVGGVLFLRSRHGNLYRAGLVMAKRPKDVRKLNEPCVHFSTTGTCPKGPQCRFMHDPDKVAICRDFLISGKCHAGANCDLSHDPTPERVPACLHFLRGNCTNPNCRYAHVRVNPGAPVCRAFATLGYCIAGSGCDERHIHECPDYANKGLCRNQKCRLPHVDRAGQLRKAAAMQNSDGDDNSSSDIDSDDDFGTYDSDDVDSEDLEAEDLIHPGDGHELSEQMDYVQV